MLREDLLSPSYYWKEIGVASKVRTPKFWASRQRQLRNVETRSLPTLARCYFTLITRTAPCLRQLPSCVAVYPRGRFPPHSPLPIAALPSMSLSPTAPFPRSRRVLCRSSHSLHSRAGGLQPFHRRNACLYSLLSLCIVASFDPHSRDYGVPRAAYDAKGNRRSDQLSATNKVARELLLVTLENCRIHFLPGSPNSFGGTSRMAFSCDHCSNLVK